MTVHPSYDFLNLLTLYWDFHFPRERGIVLFPTPARLYYLVEKQGLFNARNIDEGRIVVLQSTLNKF
jgi:hypothetical protein